MKPTIFVAKYAGVFWDKIKTAGQRGQRQLSRSLDRLSLCCGALHIAGDQPSSPGTSSISLEVGREIIFFPADTTC